MTKIRSTYPDWLYDGSEIPDPFGYGERAVEFLRRRDVGAGAAHQGSEHARRCRGKRTVIPVGDRRVDAA